MAKTLKPWTDLQDNGRVYVKDDRFPHPDCSYTVTPERLKELSSVNNKRKEVLIELDETDYTILNSENKETEGEDLSEMTVSELKALAKERGLSGYSKLTHDELVKLLSE